jgi:phage replication O-like protein O
MSETIRLNNQNLIYEQNYTQMPNVIFDYWMEVLTPAEFKVLCCIARKIFGWHKSQDKISLKQIQKMTCLSRQGVIKAISKLIEYQLVIKISSFTEDGDQAANLYTIHVHCIGGGSQLSLLGVVNSVDQGVVNSVDPQKKDNTKQKIQKEIYKEKDNGKVASSPSSHTSKFLVLGDEFKKVRLTQEELDKLVAKHGEAKIKEVINNLDVYIAQKGDKYKCHYATIYKWLSDQKLTGIKVVAKHRENYKSSFETEIDTWEPDSISTSGKVKHERT